MSESHEEDKREMNYQSLKEMDVQGRIVLLRADLNVPVKDGHVSDFTRIDRLKPTIDHLRSAGAKTVILSHFDRPKGKVVPEMSLAFLAPVLSQQWGCEVGFSDAKIGEEANDATHALSEGDVLLLENIRFYPGEEANDAAFSKQLAQLGNLYVNDAFSASHRAHASTEGIAHFLPSAAGLLMDEELSALNQALGSPKRPIMAVTGGSKISTKLNILNNLIEKVDYLVLGGAMANTFLFAQGIDVGASMCERDMADEAKAILAKAESAGCEIIVPRDVASASEVKENADFQIVSAGSIPADGMALDAGPESLTYIGEKLEGTQTVIWNGPMGVFEVPPFDKGTNALAQMVADRTKAGKCVSIAGGGDTAAALDNAGVKDDFTYISTAGGAFLEWLEGKTLPGVAALTQASKAA